VFLIAQEAARHSERTLEAYRYVADTFQRFAAEHGAQGLEAVDAPTIRAFLVWLDRKAVKDTTVAHHCRHLEAFFGWCVREEYLTVSPFARVPMPRTEKRILPAFSDEELKKLTKATTGKDKQSLRNRARVLALLDTGLRAHELLSLKVGDVDTASGMVKVSGKGGKERMIRFGPSSRQALVSYIAAWGLETGTALWQGVRGPIARFGMAQLLAEPGKTCGVHAHPHRLRRTFAISCLRSGMDVFTLQSLMGHAGLQAMRLYLAQTASDLEAAHKVPSPTDKLMGGR
jgi:integrase/recombinase XerC